MSEPVSNADELERLRADLAQRTAERGWDCFKEDGQ